ncbi:MAG: hypothetical protein KME05_18740 [Gloeocapsa sp. UFS-A4-WI-NPMV-4B04]|jgi:hypothetical protein|nr:hypothetical protein [Gloeocapsa sp. UFS-A4-WI-NPMV-4B04]
MAVASKSAVSARNRKVPSKARAGAELNQKVISLSSPALDLPNRARSNAKNVPIQLNAPKPIWLLRLYTLQRPSSAVMFLLVTVMLTVYSWTVYSQKMWSQSYNKLESLQRHERQLTTTSEVLKNKLAVQAQQPGTNLVPQNPTKAIFLPPAPQRRDRVADSILPATSNKSKQPNPSPLGY